MLALLAGVNLGKLLRIVLPKNHPGHIPACPPMTGLPGTELLDHGSQVSHL